MLDMYGKEIKALALVVGVIVSLVILINVEKYFFGTSYLYKLFGNSENIPNGKKAVNPLVIIALIILVAIPILYSFWNN